MFAANLAFRTLAGGLIGLGVGRLVAHTYGRYLERKDPVLIPLRTPQDMMHDLYLQDQARIAHLNETFKDSCEVLDRYAHLLPNND